MGSSHPFCYLLSGGFLLTCNLYMYGLYQYFILRAYHTRIEDMLTDISTRCRSREAYENCRFRGACDNCLSLAVCGCYGAKSVAEKVRKICKQDSALFHQRSHQMRNWLATFLTLLHIPSSVDSGEDWKKHCHHDAREIFLTFYREGKLELSTAVRNLLNTGVERPAFATCFAIKRYCNLLNTPGCGLSPIKGVDSAIFGSLSDLTRSEYPKVAQQALECIKVLTKRDEFLESLNDYYVIDDICVALESCASQTRGSEDDVEDCLRNLRRKKLAWSANNLRVPQILFY
ncbi:hypothetical protein Mapa_003094 [Marchantia paleacea]|nr:hypothetical protein Mapa_003094 [Marchantia paleacea]